VADLSGLELSRPGLILLTGPNGSGKSTAARALGARVAGAQALSAESQQAFYEAQLAADEANFQQGADTSRRVGELLGERGRSHPLFASFRLEPLWERHYRQLSTGEARKVLLLQSVLASPPLLILDDPFDGLDRAACAELAHAITAVAQRLPLIVVGALEMSGASGLPFAPEAVREVVVFASGRVAFRGSPQAFLTRAADRRGAGRCCRPAGDRR
jgi:ABC-type multidrug transport system ATPase subunit